MPLSPNDLAWVRKFVGDTTPPTDDDLDEIYDRYVAIDGTRTVAQHRSDVAEEVLTKRLADYLANPAQFIVPGEYGQNTSSNINHLREVLSQLRLASGSSFPTRIIPMVRAETCR